MKYERIKWTTSLRFFHSRKKRKTPFKSIKGEITNYYKLYDIKIPLGKQKIAGIEIIWL